MWVWFDMKVKSSFLEVSKTILGQNEFVLIGMDSYKKYDQATKKYTDEIAGTKYIVVVHNPSKEILYEKLEVKVPGTCTIPNYIGGNEVYCKFTNLVLTVSSIEYGKAELRATADKIELLQEK